MPGTSRKKREYWYPKIEKKQRTRPTYKPNLKTKNFSIAIIIPEGPGEYCNYCGAIAATLEKKGLDPMMMISHDDNNRYNNTLPNLFFTCRGCNRRKDPHTPIHERRQISQSEATNKRAEKPWADWIFQMLQEGKTVEWGYAVSEGAFKFDVSVDTIEKRWYRKYFESESGPFELTHDQDLGKDIVILKDFADGRTIENVSPTPPITSTD